MVRCAGEAQREPTAALSGDGASLWQRYPVTAPAGAAAQWHLIVLEFGFAVRVHAKVTSVDQHTDAGGHLRTDQTRGSVIGDTDRIFREFLHFSYSAGTMQKPESSPQPGCPGRRVTMTPLTSHGPGQIRRRQEQRVRRCFHYGRTNMAALAAAPTPALPS